ncbi:MAG TPA: protein kinase [Candidatus Limnocylindrales bacterium]|nr:protein kinase [Candidatus Limnocylindrales bacterium]
MSEQWKKWEGQPVDGKFVLGPCLASTEFNAVFLTELPEPPGQKAVLKLVAAGSPAAEAQLGFWKRAAHLTHPNLLTIFDAGRCHLEDVSFIYVVMEYAEENLGEILPQRALTPEEVRDVLDPALDVLVYLHGKGLVHGHVKPSNILATHDRLKLSSDSVFPIGEQRQLLRGRDIYDAPEMQSAPVSAKEDVWSLGVTLVEALTQHPPVVSSEQSADPVVPRELPDLFLVLAKHALRRDPHHRWSIAEIAARLNPAPLAAAAAVSSFSPVSPVSPMAPPAPMSNLSPINVPLANEPAVPLAKMPSPLEIPPRRVSPPLKRGNLSLSDYLVPVLLGAAVFAGLIFAIPKLFNFRSQPSSTSASVTSQLSAPAKPAESAEPAPVATPAARTPERIAASEPPNKPNRAAENSSPAPSPAVLRADPAPAPRAKSAGEAVGRGEVLNEVLPKPPQKALNTIHGTFHVLVKVQVDAAGNVISSELDSPGPSKYFAGLAEKAARQWQFSGAEAAGHGIPSAWLIRFEFTSAGVHATAQQSTH